MLSNQKPETIRPRDQRYLDYIRSCPCCICQRTPVEAAHLRIGSINDDKPATGMQQKSSDRWALPLCHQHHVEQHAMGNELEFWASYGLDPFALSMHYQARPR